MTTFYIVIILQLDFLQVNYTNVLGLDLSHQVFHNLRMVKINSFRGYANEIRLVKFLLSKAIALNSGRWFLLFRVSMSQ